MKTKIDIFSGFLGAGKTMLIKKLINEKLINEKLYNENIVIIEKELDKIDEIIKKYKPQRIIMEPSGVGKFSDVLHVIKDSKMNNELTQIL